MAGLFRNLFKKNKSSEHTDRIEVMSGSPAIFTPFSGDAYESDIYLAAVDAIARNAAKLKGCHVMTMEQQRKNGDNQFKPDTASQAQPLYERLRYDL